MSILELPYCIVFLPILLSPASVVGTAGRAKRPPRKQKARRKAGLQGGSAVGVGSDARHHVFQPQKMCKRFELAPLIVAEAHDQREAGGLEPVDVDLAHVDRRGAGAALAFLVFHL